MAAADSALGARAHGRGRPGTRAASVARVRRGVAGAYRWLRADIRESISMELIPGSSTGVEAPSGDLRTGLLRWASRLRRRRALVVARRHLIAAAAVVIAAELVLDVFGGERRAPWLLAPLALGLLDGAIALGRGVSLDTVAQMLDRRLALRDRVTTANDILQEQAPPSGLRALVVAEAGTAVADSFATVRLVARHPRREWLSLLAGVAVIALLATAPRIGPNASANKTAAGARRAPRGALAQARPEPAVASPAPPRLPAVTSPRGLIGRPPLAVTGSGTGKGGKQGFSPYGYGATSLSAKQLAREGITAPPTAGAKGLAPLSVGEAGGGGSTSATSSAPSARSGGTSGTPSAGNGGSAALSRGSLAAAPGGAVSSAGARSGRAPQAGGAKGGGTGAGAAGSGSSPPGGNAAGSAPGSTELTSGLVPALAPGSSGLPLQAGYAPSNAPRSAGGEGVSQTPNGGGKGGRSAHTSAGAEGSVSAGLSVIPPASNSTPALDQALLSGYFGAVDQLVPSNW